MVRLLFGNKIKIWRKYRALFFLRLFFSLGVTGRRRSSMCSFAPTSSCSFWLLFGSAKYFVMRVSPLCFGTPATVFPHPFVLCCWRAEWVYVRGSMVLEGGGVVLVVCVGRLAGLIPGFSLSLELRSWLSSPEVAAGG